MTLQEIRDAIAAGASGAALADLEAQLAAYFAELSALEITDDVIAELEEVTVEIEKVRAMAAAEVAAAEARAARLAELRAQVEPTEDEAPAEDAEAEVVAEAEAIVEAAPVAVTAAAKPTPIARVRERAPQDIPAATVEGRKVFATYQAPSAGIVPGNEMKSLDQALTVFHHAANTSTGKTVALREQSNYGDFALSSQAGDAEVRSLLKKQMEGRSLTAAGGICGPLDAYRNPSLLGSEARPVRDALPALQTTGGVRYVPSARLSDITAGVAVHTAANDAADATKAEFELTCGTPEEVVLDAIFVNLKLSNMSQMSNPQRYEDIVKKMRVLHARTAEQNLQAAIHAAADTRINKGQDFSYARDLFNGISRAAAGYRYRNRLENSEVLTVMLPAFVADAYRADLQSSAYPGIWQDVFTDAEIAAKYAESGINIVWTLDAPTAAFGFAASEPLNSNVDNFPTQLRWFMFHDGAVVFLDGGSLDLGVMRDSAVASTNRAVMFSETFEQVIFPGLEVVSVTQNVYAYGGSIGTIAPATGADAVIS